MLRSPSLLDGKGQTRFPSFINGNSGKLSLPSHLRQARGQAKLRGPLSGTAASAIGGYDDNIYPILSGFPDTR